MMLQVWHEWWSICSKRKALSSNLSTTKNTVNYSLNHWHICCPSLCISYLKEIIFITSSMLQPPNKFIMVYKCIL
jgi:hypothetical protein